MTANTHRYQIADLILETNVPIPEATTAEPSSQTAECRLEWMDSRAVVPKATDPFHRWVDAAGKPFVWFYHREGGYQIRVRGIADFLVSSHAEEIRCYPRQKIPAEIIRQLFLEVVLPAALSRRGRLSLHASAVATPGGVIGFLGGGGQGKSTLAVGLSRRGFALVCDDSMVLKQERDRMVVVPELAGVRLWPDSVAALLEEASHELPVTNTEKRRFSREERAAEAMPLVRLYMLESSPDRDIKIEKLSPDDALVELIKCSHMLDITDKELIRMKFNELTVISNQIPSFRIEFPHDYSRLEELCEVVTQDR